MSFALKLVLAPVLIGGASLVARRWGPSIGGWLVALPLTSGPVLLFLALDQGPGFAATAATGALTGLAAIAAFGLAYAISAGPGPLGAIVAGTAAFAAVGIVLQPVLDDPTWVVLGVVLCVIGLALRSLPAGGSGRVVAVHPPWDLPARMTVAALLVFGLTTVAPLVGPHASGLLATFPVYVSVMVTFTHRQAGVPAAVDLLRGLLVGLFGTAAFYVVVRESLGTVGTGPSFAAAILAALVIQAGAFRVVRTGPSPGTA